MVRKLEASTGRISIVAGTLGVEGSSGDGGLATSARLAYPQYVVVDRAGNLYIAPGYGFEFQDCRVRKVDAVTGIITTVAGNDGCGFLGDGGPATSAALLPRGLAVDLAGNLYIADESRRVRRVNLGATGASRLTLAAGNSQTVFFGYPAPVPLDVAATSAAGTPLSGVTVQFRVVSGNVRLSAASAVTNQTGLASVALTAGLTAGPAVVEATATGLNRLVFNLTVAPLPRPQVNTGGVVGAGLSRPPLQSLAPGSIASIFGNFFAVGGSSAVVTGADLVEGRLPTKFAGVCVDIGPQRAPIFAIFPGQINLQVPDIPLGSAVRVQVVTNCEQPNGAFANTADIAVRAAAPEFFYFSQTADGRNPIAAVEGSTGALIGPSFTPAKPGDVLILFATGLGATTPAVAPGQIPAVAARVNAEVKLTLAGREVPPANLDYVGVTPGNAGLYQVNLRLPADTPDGSLAMVLTVGGIASPVGYLSVAR